MPNIPSTFNYELPDQLQYAHQILENSKSLVSAATVTATAASTPTITSIDGKSAGDFLQFLGASLFNSIQLQNLHRTPNRVTIGNSTAGVQIEDSASELIVTTPSMDIDMYAPNHVVIDSSSFGAMDELQKQLEYDKFMNEVWIGIVLTLILISMIFCICSCFLYHQFRTWKRNYHSTVSQSQISDMEAIKLQADIDDPVPEYTLVSGLPSYEAALELLQRSPQSCLLVHPSVFSIFTKNEKMPMATDATATIMQQPMPQQQQQVLEVTVPLLSATSNTTTTTTNTSPSMGSKSLMTLPTCHNSRPSGKNKSKPNTMPATIATATPLTTATTPTTATMAATTATLTLPSYTYAKTPMPSNASKQHEKH